MYPILQKQGSSPNDPASTQVSEQWPSLCLYSSQLHWTPQDARSALGSWHFWGHWSLRMHLLASFSTKPGLHWHPIMHWRVQSSGFPLHVSGHAVPQAVNSSFSLQVWFCFGHSCLWMHVELCLTNPGMHSQPMTHWKVQCSGRPSQLSGQAVPQFVHLSLVGQSRAE